MDLFRLAAGAIIATAALTLLHGIASALDLLQGEVHEIPVVWSLVLGISLLILARSSYKGNPTAFMLALGLSTLEFCRGTLSAIQADSYVIEVIRAALILMMLPGILAVREMESKRREDKSDSSDQSEDIRVEETAEGAAADLEQDAEVRMDSLENQPATRRKGLWGVIAVLGLSAFGLLILLGMMLINCDPRAQADLQLGCVFDGPLPAPTEWVPYTEGHLNFAFTHPSDWTVYESPDFISVTRNDRTAEVNFGWFPRLEGETNDEFMARLTATTAAFYSDVELVTRPHEGGDPIEVLLTGVDADGTRWIIDLVVSGADPRVFTVQSLAQEDVLDEVQPVFDGVIQSLEIIEN